MRLPKSMYFGQNNKNQISFYDIHNTKSAISMICFVNIVMTTAFYI